MAICRSTLSQPTWRKTARHRHLKHCSIMTNIEELIVWYDCKQALNPGVGEVYSGIWIIHVVSLHQGIYSSMLSEIWQKVDIISNHSYAYAARHPQTLQKCEFSWKTEFRTHVFFMNDLFQKRIQLHFKWIHFRFDWVKWYNACPGYYATVKEIGWQLAWWILFQTYTKVFALWCIAPWLC